MPSIGSVFATFGAKDNLTPQIKKMQGSLGNFDKRMKASSAGFAKFGTSATAAGKKMTMGLTAPIVGLGVASFKMASDFEASMTKIQSLVGKSEQEVASLTKSVMGLAGSTARAPQELAEAMFFITSAGIDAADAAGVLEASAKAAAVGLGDTATIADLATSAMNAYGKENLSASNATDVMVAAVREGKLEASELAGSMGRVLPIASAMGVSFNEVGAAFASLSRTGTNAAEAATQVRGILSSLLRPTVQAEEALTGMGLSSEGLREQLQEKGLLSTLKTLADEFDGNAAASASVFGNVRALSGVMDLMGKNVAGTEAIFASMNDTLGATDAAFKVTSETSAFKMSQAISDFKVAMITLGQTVIPIVLPMVQKLAAFIAAAAEKFDSLSGPAKTAIVVMGGLVAVAGPLLVAIGMISTALSSFAGGVMAILGPIGLAIAAIGLITFAIVKLTGANDDFKQKVDQATEALATANPELEGATTRMQALADTIPDAVEPLDNLSESLKETAKQSLFVQHGMEEGLGDAFIRMMKLGVKFEDVLDTDIAALEKYTGALDGNVKMSDEAEFHFNKMSDAGQDVAKQLQFMEQQGKLTKKEMRKLIDSIDDTSEALVEAAKQSEKAAQEFLDSGDAMKILEQEMGFTTEAALIYSNNLDKIAADDGPREAVAQLSAAVDQQTLALDFAAAEFVNYRGEVENAEAAVNKFTTLTNSRKVEVDFMVDLPGLMQQLNDATMMIADAGSFGGANDQMNMIGNMAHRNQMVSEEIQRQQVEEANKAAVSAAKAAQRAHDAAVKEAERIFNSFVSSAIGIGGAAIGDTFVKAMLGEPEDIAKAFKDLFDTAFKSGLTQIPELRSTFMKALEGEALLIEMAEKRAELSTKLETAEDRLTKALENQASAQSRVNKLASDRASLASKTASAFGFEFGEDIGAKAQADKLLAQYTAFESNLKALQTKGFPADIITQVIGLGAFAGNEAATGLLAMGETDFASFTTALAGISAIGAKIGEIQAGITFSGAQSTAASDLLGATASAEGALAARNSLKTQASTAELEAFLLGNKVAGELATGIQGVLQGMPGMTEESAAALKQFSTEIAAFLGGNGGAGIFDLQNNPALGALPELLKAQQIKAKTVATAAMPKGTPNDPIAVTDNKVLEAVKASLSPAQQFNADTAAVQAANRAVTDIVGGAGFQMADAASLGIADALFDRAMKAPELQMAYEAADFGSLMTNPTSSRGPSAAQMDGMNVTVNVAGSVTTDRGIAEMVRQIALENQNSGTEWAPADVGFY